MQVGVWPVFEHQLAESVTQVTAVAHPTNRLPEAIRHRRARRLAGHFARRNIAIGAAGPNDDILRNRLVVSGDLAAGKTTGAFDEAVAEAVKRFQVRHGLAPTGTGDAAIIAAMNVPVLKRIRQLEASLERVQNMNFGFGQRYVVVNIPATFAEAVENYKVVRRYRVIVGKTEKPSPTTAEITGASCLTRHLDRTVLDRENRDLLYGENSGLSLTHAHGSAGHA